MADQLRNKWLLRLFYWMVRLGMGATFVISGLRKLPGVKFTTLPTHHPVGAFFQAMHDTGLYWNTIGYVQIVLGLLLFVNRTVAISGLLMMPITVNIFLVSISLNMRGTPVITTCMLLGNLFLMCWHYENYLSLLKAPNTHVVQLRRSEKQFPEI